MHMLSNQYIAYSEKTEARGEFRRGAGTLERKEQAFVRGVEDGRVDEPFSSMTRTNFINLKILRLALSFKLDDMLDDAMAEFKKFDMAKILNS